MLHFQIFIFVWGKKKSHWLRNSFRTQVHLRQFCQLQLALELQGLIRVPHITLHWRINLRCWDLDPWLSGCPAFALSLTSDPFPKFKLSDTLNNTFVIHEYDFYVQPPPPPSILPPKQNSTSSPPACFTLIMAAHSFRWHNGQLLDWHEQVSGCEAYLRWSYVPPLALPCTAKIWLLFAIAGRSLNFEPNLKYRDCTDVLNIILGGTQSPHIRTAHADTE